MIDVDSGEIGYAVLSFGGILGLGNKLFAVPWDALKVDTDRKCFVMNAWKDSLERAHGFDKDNWPDAADPRWLISARNYYPSRSTWAVPAPSRPGMP